MTHSGGKPHAIGDRGQRYEISFTDEMAKKGHRRILGWTDIKGMADRMAASVEKHTGWSDGRVLDRQAKSEK